MGEQLHFVLVPFMAQGHMIPMADLGLLLAARGARVSLITTPVNAHRLRASTDRAAAGVLPLPLRLVELPFPCSAAGLPEGCENIDLVPRPELFPPFCKAPNLLVEPLKQYLRRYPPAPTCIIADQCMPWTMTVAKDLKIPRLVFHGPSCFYLLCIHNIFKHKAYDTVAGDLAAFPVPELPERIEVNRLQAQKFFNSPEMEDIQRHVDEAEKVADGFVLNTFYELEPWYIDAYSKAVGKKVWTVGPVSLFHEDITVKAVRGNGGTSGGGHDGVLRWLDGKLQQQQQQPGSVLFVSFGSIARTLPRQMVEIGGALEAVGRPFVWAVKEAEKSEEAERWLSEFEARNAGEGMVLKGWVPQVLILSHPAVGGFMTHCGWNSTMEAVAAGVAMVTWPLFADQFLNEKLVVEVLGTGVGVGAKLPAFYQMAGEVTTVRKEQIERAVERVMGGGEGAEGRRRRAREWGKMARKTVLEGGSSYENLRCLIDHASELCKDKLEGISLGLQEVSEFEFMCEI